MESQRVISDIAIVSMNRRTDGAAVYSGSTDDATPALCLGGPDQETPADPA